MAASSTPGSLQLRRWGASVGRLFAALAASAFWPISYLAAERGYARLWSVTLLSELSAYLARGALYIWVADHWVAMDAAATLVLAEGAAAVLAAPLAGRLIERIGPRRAVILADAAGAAAIAAACPLFRWSVACAVLFVLATFRPLHQAARNAALNDVVGYDGLARASGLDQLAGNVAIAAGPLLGTILTLHSGVVVALGVAAGGHLVAAWAARGLPRTTPNAGEPAAAAAARVIPDRRLLAALLVFGCSTVAAGLWLAAAPGLIASVSDEVARRYGLQFAAAGAAALVGSATAPVLIERWGSWRVLGAFSAAEAIAFLAYAFSGHALVMDAGVTLVGFCAAVMSTAFYTRLQQRTAPAARGRTFALARQIDGGGILCAGLFGRAAGAAIPGYAVLGAAAAVYLGAAVQVMVMGAGAEPAREEGTDAG